MTTKTVTLYFHALASAKDGVQVALVDMRRVGWPLLGTKTVEVEVPEVEAASLPVKEQEAIQVQQTQYQQYDTVRTNMGLARKRLDKELL